MHDVLERFSQRVTVWHTWGMTKPPHPLDIRERLLAAIDAGLPLADAVRFFQVSARTIRRWRRRKRLTGSTAPTGRPGRRSSIIAAHQTIIRDLVLADPDLTLAQLCDRLAEATGLRVRVPTMSRQLRLLAITRKKRV